MPALKRSNTTVLVRNDSRYGSKKKARLTPQTYTKKTSNLTEVKNTYGNHAWNAVTTGTIQLYGQVAAGNGEHDRNGKAVIHLNQDLRYRIDRIAGNASSNIRVIVGIFKQMLGGAPIVSDILDAEIGGMQYFLAPFNAENSTNYIILDDEYINFPAAVAGGTLTGGSGSIAPAAGTLCLNRKYTKRFVQEYQSTAEQPANWSHFCLVVGNIDSQTAFEISYNCTFTDN